MITTPEQMREAAIDAVENEIAKAKSMFAHLDHYDLYFDGLQDALICIRAIPIAPQPSDPLSDPRVVALVEAMKIALSDLESNGMDDFASANIARAALRAIGGEA